ncbi:aminotransferase class V-fold PLP-dependent enzyme [Halomonas sp. PR-M31]|uniref:aminotransferase class V-fold PLP-dependent enzyme n=1 Tax=Halomonas sp. PR-M31 TaxID=1471202 RepID=UPI000650B452|nr:aminotransferase class V-fold PLP-dependent enzyme [Halomonas sp. PR-M31]
MPGLRPDVDPNGLLEYSVVYSDRSLNHMSKAFQNVVNDVLGMLKDVYSAHSAILMPGSGTFGMEAVARQFAQDRKVLVIRNGWFSYRWTQIFEMGNIPAQSTVMKARRLGDDKQAPFAPAPIEEVVANIEEQRPDLVFAPHVETSAGMILPQDYLKQVADAVHKVNGLFVLDCIASGTAWVDMQSSGVDVLISAPQKGWSGSPGCAMVMLSERAEAQLKETTSSSFAADLSKWRDIMAAYENGGHAYHATLPTDGLAQLRDVMKETQDYGFAKVCDEQWELGKGVRAMLADHGFKSVAAEGFQAPGVVVCYTEDAGIAGKFGQQGVQVAAGIPLMCDEGDDFQTFRIGLFGLDKLHNVKRSVGNLEQALNNVIG